MSINISNVNSPITYFNLNKDTSTEAVRHTGKNIPQVKTGDSVQLSHKINVDEVDTEKLLGEIQGAGHEQIADVHEGLTLERVMMLIEGADG